MKISVVAIATVALSLVDPSHAAIGRAISLGIRAGVKAGEAINDAVNNDDNKKRSDFDEEEIYPRYIPNIEDIPRAQVQARSRNANKKNQNKQNQNTDLPEPAATLCQNQLKGKSVSFTVGKNNDVTIKNIPPACMTLATVFLSDQPDGGAPVPLGNNILKYTKVSKADIQQLRSTLQH